MSTHLAFSWAQKARRISVLPTFSDVARPRLDGGMASANVGESKVTREKKRREGEDGKRRTAAAVALNSARLMGDASLASSATQLPASRVKERGRTRTSNDKEVLARLTKACKAGRRGRSSRRRRRRRIERAMEKKGMPTTMRGAWKRGTASRERRAKHFAGGFCS
ncbi:hypothetical protein X777_02791 [Ooceraea biroi]|uniref:Uncharacterized protein n=1 Tax=Ooceraea biroi TaxID=2015173 RepID=A0A026WLL9_OOCBI|nr:hypothetical protein X777_02791 [Ooceraea biroi]